MKTEKEWLESLYEYSRYEPDKIIIMIMNRRQELKEKEYEESEN